MSDRDVDFILGPPLVIRRGDGSSYTVPGAPSMFTHDPLGHARREYLAGRIDVEEFEQRVGEALEHDEAEGVRL